MKMLLPISTLVLLSGLSANAQTATEASRLEMEQAYHQYEAAYSKKDFDESLVHAKQAYELAQHILPETDETLAIVTYNYGENLVRDWQSEKAKKILAIALVQHEALYGEDTTMLIPVLLSLGEAGARSKFGARESHNASISFFRRAMKISRKISGENSVQHANVLFSVGDSLLNDARSPNAKRYLEDSLEIYAREFGETSPQAGLVAFNMGVLSIRSERWSSAEKFLIQALGAYDIENSSFRAAHLQSRALLVRVFESSGRSDMATEHCIAIGRATSDQVDSKYEPLFRTAPKYPSGALSANVSGYVDLSFTVDANGFVANPEVIKLTGSDQFVDAAILATKQWRYAPRFESGLAVDTAGVKTRVRFAIVD